MACSQDHFAENPEETAIAYSGTNLNHECEKELYWIQFLLPGILPSVFKKIIIIDVDLRFRTDVMNLYEYFDHMSSEESLGLGKEWANEALGTSWYRGRTLTGMQYGEPYPFTQGVNSGVVLMNLEKLRKDNKYKRLFSPKKLNNYLTELKILNLSDQIVYVLIKWKEKNQVYVLPCLYNYQIHVPKIFEDNGIKLEFPSCRDCYPSDYYYCKGDPLIEHHNHDRNIKDLLFPILYKYNNFFKLSTWCDLPEWKHCY